MSALPTPLLTFDEEANAGYLRLRDEPVSRTVQLTDSVLIDLAEDGSLIGVESTHGPVNDAVLYAVLTHGWVVALREGGRRAAAAIRRHARRDGDELVALQAASRYFDPVRVDQIYAFDVVAASIAEGGGYDESG